MISFALATRLDTARSEAKSGPRYITLVHVAPVPFSSLPCLAHSDRPVAASWRPLSTVATQHTSAVQCSAAVQQRIEVCLLALTRQRTLSIVRLLYSPHFVWSRPAPNSAPPPLVLYSPALTHTPPLCPVSMPCVY